MTGISINALMSFGAVNINTNKWLPSKIRLQEVYKQQR